MEVSMNPMQRFWQKVDRRGADECWIWRGRIRKNYGEFQVTSGGKKRTFRAHRVALGGLEPVFPQLFVCHHCDNPGCVNPDHLFVGTQKDNAQDALMKGRHYVGEKNGRSKLTKENVKEILASDLNGKQLADKFGVTRSTINNVRRGDTWQK